MQNHTQVIIIGAGPAGVTLALLLAQQGITVKLIEASRTFRRTFRGEGLMPSGLDALAQMGFSSILNRIPHRPLDAWKVLINGRLLFQVKEPIEPEGQPCTLVSQPALLEALVEEAIALPNFELLQGTAVQELVWEGERVSGVRVGGDRTLTADLVIGTDGRNSLLRQKANLSLEQQSKNFDILWFKLADSPQLELENVFYSIVQGPHTFGLFRSSEGNLQVGWALRDNTTDWKQVDWTEQLASASPPWLADHFRTHADTLEHPVLLSVVVGHCPRWSIPGLLLLGDAAHPMSPIRAQGINMALRDVLVAANHLIPLLKQGAGQGAIDQAIAQVQEERSPEILRVQQLQAEEAAQADKLGNSALLRWGVSQFAPLLRYPVRWSWLKRQRQLRQGTAPIRLHSVE
ncbi:FAD-dependent monooxygenase [Leptolyngbya sp. FACHB-541]|uniref:FAD-dependent monooxygenase n=1 Tax=Leptolyngbya sp. FACHB-541 TaxID=2692810 RepID=UPI0016877F47|nr:FAD-dependent monooxygenase [Leptolyngbya sp. FACHB-541]